MSDRSTSNSTALKLPSIVDPETQKVITRGRLENPAALCSAWDSLWQSDLASSEARMRAQQWRDGMTPYSPRRESLMGNAGRTNVNWGLGDQIATDAEMPYNDILDGVDTLFSMPTNWGEEGNRVYVEQVMAEEITRMLRGWSQFDPRYQQNVRLFVDEGVSFAFFEDDFGWKWDILGLQHLVFPRRVKADINEIDIVVAKRQLLPHKLYERCKNEDVSASEGWNRDATWEAIKTAAQPSLSANDYQEWERAWKDHDYVLGNTTITVEIIEGWVREVDGTVSHYMCRSDAEGDFIYKKEGKYSDMSHMLIPFLYGVGANGDFQSIHGVLQKTFAAGMAQNKVFNRMMDTAIISSTPYLQCKTEEALEELPLTPQGAYVAVSPGYEWMEAKIPPFQESLIPLMTQLNSFLTARSSPYTQNVGAAIDKTQRTKYEKQSQDEASSKLSSSGITLFKNGLTMLYREVARRVIRAPYPQSWAGGPEVQEFIARCEKRGVPIEAIRKVDVKRIEVNMGIGRGSAAARRVSADSLNTLYTRADAKGQNIINYVIASSYCGSALAREVFPPQPGLRPPQDMEDANNENSAIISMASLQLPQTIVVLPTQNHAVHIQAHLAGLGALNDGLLNQNLPMEKAIPAMQPLLDHAMGHLKLVDPLDPDRGTYVSDLKQFREVITNGAKQLQAQAEKAQREAEHNGTPMGADGQIDLAAQKTQQEMGHADQAHQANLQAQQAKLQAEAQEKAMKAKQLAASLMIQSAQAQQKLNDSHLDSTLRAAEFEKKQAREDALYQAKIEKLGLRPDAKV